MSRPGYSCPAINGKKYWRFHRISADNDLHILETELLACHHAMLAYGLHTETPEECLEQEDEITYQVEKKRLYIEVHRSLFDTSDEAPDDLNIFFKDAVKNAVEMDGFLAMPTGSCGKICRCTVSYS